MQNIFYFLFFYQFLVPRFLRAVNIYCSCRWHIAGWKTHWYSWV